MDFYFHAGSGLILFSFTPVCLWVKYFNLILTFFRNLSSPRLQSSSALRSLYLKNRPFDVKYSFVISLSFLSFKSFKNTRQFQILSISKSAVYSSIFKNPSILDPPVDIRHSFEAEVTVKFSIILALFVLSNKAQKSGKTETEWENRRVESREESARRKEEDSLSLYRKRRKKHKRHKVHRLGRFRVEENSTLERARSEKDEDRGPVDAPGSRSTRRSSTIGLESPVPVYGSGVVRGFFEQQADQVERLPVESWTRCSSMRARQTDLRRSSPARKSKSPKKRSLSRLFTQKSMSRRKRRRRKGSEDHEERKRVQ